MSRPSRARGLKQNPDVEPVIEQQSRPSRARGLKLDYSMASATANGRALRGRVD